jgi:surface polysaccharide O-acyltransferase-like enzyme
LERNNSIDIIKFFAMMGIVCIHTAPFFNVDFKIINGIYIGTILNIVCRISVPLFFIAFGYFLYNKISTSCNEKKYLIKYIKRTISVLVNWILIYFNILYMICLFFQKILKNLIYKFSVITLVTLTSMIFTTPLE